MCHVFVSNVSSSLSSLRLLQDTYIQYIYSRLQPSFSLTSSLSLSLCVCVLPVTSNAGEYAMALPSTVDSMKQLSETLKQEQIQKAKTQALLHLNDTELREQLQRGNQ